MDADFDRAGAADDAGPRLLLWRARAFEECPQHDDDELHLAWIRRHPVGADRLLAGADQGQQLDRRSVARAVEQRRARGRGRHRPAHHPAPPLHGLSGHVLHHHGGPDLRCDRRAHALPGLRRCSSRCGRSSSTRRSRIGSGAEAGLPTWARWTLPVARSCTSTPPPRRSWRRSSSASARDIPPSSLLPHSVPFTLLGAGLLWFGWFGFNAGSALAASPIAGLAFVTTMLAPAATLVVWTFLDVDPVGQADSRRLRHGDRRRSGGHHPGGRIRGADGRDHHRRDRGGSELSRLW